MSNSSQDTADTYSNGKSEIVLGKALKKFNIPRSKVVIMTKIFNPVMDDNSRPASVNDGPLVNQMGLSRKHVFEAVDRCLERLGTDYIGAYDFWRSSNFLQQKWFGRFRMVPLII